MLLLSLSCSILVFLSPVSLLWGTPSQEPWPTRQIGSNSSRGPDQPVPSDAPCTHSPREWESLSQLQPDLLCVLVVILTFCSQVQSMPYCLPLLFHPGDLWLLVACLHPLILCHLRMTALKFVVMLFTGFLLSSCCYVGIRRQENYGLAAIFPSSHTIFEGFQPVPFSDSARAPGFGGSCMFPFTEPI